MHGIVSAAGNREVDNIAPVFKSGRRGHKYIITEHCDNTTKLVSADTYGNIERRHTALTLDLSLAN